MRRYEKMPLHHNAAALEQKIRKRLGLSGDQELRYRIIRKSIDARKKPELSLVYSVEVSTSGEEKIIKRANDPNVTIVKQTGYHLPGAVSPTPSIPPVIVGAGPAGLFCAYALTMSGCAPVVLERGRSVTERTKDVSASGRAECWIRFPTCSSERAAQELFRTAN